MLRRTVDHVARGWAVASLVFWVTLLAALVAGTAVDDARAATAGPATPADDAPSIEQRRDEPRTTLEAIEPTVMCPSCDSTLDQSNSPAADRMRAWISAAVDAGWTADEIRDGLVDEYDGDESVLATPRSSTLGTGAWLAPALIVLGIIAAAVILPRRWRRGVGAQPGADPWSASSSSSSNDQSA